MKKLLIPLFVMLAAFSVRAQDLQETLSNLSQDAAKAYVKPIVSAFGANMNSGWIHRAVPNKTFGIDFEVGLVVMGTLFSDDSKKFTANGSFRFNTDQATQLTTGMDNTWGQRDTIIKYLTQEDFTVGISGPTIIGSKSENLVISFGGKTYTVNTPLGPRSETVQPDTISIPGVAGFIENLPAIPLVAPQLTLGTFFGTAVAIRYLPETEITKDLGKVKYFGFGIQHNPSMWIPFPMPIDISAGFFTQTLEVGSIFKSTATSFGVYASKQIGPGFLSVTPYVGFLLESSDITVKYDFELKDTPTPGTSTVLPIEFKVEGENKSRILLGASFKIGLFNINADYNIGKYKSASAGFAFNF